MSEREVYSNDGCVYLNKRPTLMCFKKRRKKVLLKGNNTVLYFHGEYESLEHSLFLFIYSLTYTQKRFCAVYLGHSTK